MKNSAQKSSRPPSSVYIADLGYDYTYPKEYLECIDWERHDLDAGGDGHALSFLASDEVRKKLYFTDQVSRKRLIPFAQGEDGDSLFCFDGEGLPDIYVIDLGEKPLTLRNTGFKNFVAFINDNRSRYDLAPWNPKSGEPT